MTILLVALGLQFCDGLTTLLFLRHGVSEGNPLVAALMHFPAGPAAALLILKIAGCGMALFAWKSRRTRLLRRANVFFAVCVGWNLLALARA
jgi:hypothetical protein